MNQVTFPLPHADTSRQRQITPVLHRQQHKALGLARSMTYRRIKPTVRKITKVYQKGISVAKSAMWDIEARLERNEELEHWFIKIVPQT